MYAHLSAFSCPWSSYHAFPSGSDIASTSSWDQMETMASVPTSPFGETCWLFGEHPARQDDGFPMKAYLMSTLLTLPLVWNPQY